MRGAARLVVALLLLASWMPVQAQDAPVVLTLEQAIARAQRNSPGARIARLELERARWNHRAYEASYLPAISLTGNAPGLLRSITDVVQDDGSVRYVPQAQMSSLAGVSVEQALPWTGGRLSVTSGLRRLNFFDEPAANQWHASPLIVELEQPILQFNAMKWDRRIEPLTYRAADRRAAADLADVAVNVTARFFDVVIAQLDVQRATFNVAVNDTIYTLSEGRYALGRIAENELLQSELALLNARTQLSDARIALGRAEQALKTALDWRRDGNLEAVPPVDVPQIDADPAAAVEQARRHRADFLDLDLSELRAERDVVRERRANSFSATMTASYGLNQSAATFGQVYHHPLNQQRFSVGFQLPLYRWGGGEAAVEAALADQARVREEAALRREDLEQEVHFEALQLEQLQQQVRTAAKADTVAARRFEVARGRYTVGKIDIRDLFDAQQAKDAASQAYVRTLRQFWVSYFQLRRLTLVDLETGTALIRPSATER